MSINTTKVDNVTLLTLALLLLATASFTLDYFTNPPAGRWARVCDKDGLCLQGNYSYMQEYYDTHKAGCLTSNWTLNLNTEKPACTTEAAARMITCPTTSSTSTTTSTSTSTTTFKLKHQGNMSSNFKTNPTTTTTIREWLVQDFMQTCDRNEDCVIVYGCCFNSYPTAINTNYSKYYRIYLHCPLKTQCSPMIKPQYRAYCNDKKCVKEEI